jgi:GT2 family glycosyltransferase
MIDILIFFLCVGFGYNTSVMAASEHSDFVVVVAVDVVVDIPFISGKELEEAEEATEGGACVADDDADEEDDDVGGGNGGRDAAGGDKRSRSEN